MIDGMDPLIPVTSKSASEANSTMAQNTLSHSFASKNIYPLFDKMTQFSHPPSIIYYFFLLVLFIQLIFITTWPSHTEIWESNNISKNFVKYFAHIANFSPGYSTEQNLMISFLVYTILFVLYMGCFLLQIIIIIKFCSVEYPGESQCIIAYLDFFLIKFITRHHHSIKALYHCIRILVCLPCNHRSMNHLYLEAIKRRDTKFYQRFMLLQVQKIKFLRQSASSTQTDDRIEDLKQQTKDLQNSMNSFWQMTSPSIGFLKSTSNNLKKMKSLWEESLAEFPNSIQYIEENITFLIECNCDFVSAIKSRNKIDLIEDGKNYNVEMCFIQFARTFPNYLKKVIIDIKGNFIFNQKTPKTSGSQSISSTGNNDSSSKYLYSSSMSELEVAVEEEIGKVLINQSRIRLAMQRATETKKANGYFTLLISIIFLFAAGLILSFVLYFKFNNYFDGRLSTEERISLINQVRLYLFETTLMIVYHWGEEVNASQIEEVIDEIVLQDKEGNMQNDNFMNTSSEVTYSMRAATFGKLLKDKYHEFLTNVAEQSKKGVDMHRFASPLFDETSVINFTDLGIVYNSTTSYNLNNVLTYLSFCCTMLMGETDREKLNQFYKSSKYFGTLITSIQTVTDPLDIIMSTLKKMSQDEAEDSKKMLPILSILLAVVYGVVSIALTVIMGILYIREIRKFAQMLLNLPENVKKDSISSIRKVTAQETTTDEQEIDVLSGSGKKSFTSIILLVVISIVYIAVYFLIYFHIKNVEIFNQKYMYLSMWQNDSRIRKSHVAQLCLWISQAIIYSNPLVNETNFINFNAMRFLIEKDLSLLDDATKDMLEEKSNYPSPIGVNSLIDNYTFQALCTMNESVHSLHEEYRCGSLRNQLSFF